MAKHSENRRNEIIQAAASLFRQKGFEKATVRDLGNLVGIKSGSLFHYFNTKYDILIALMEETIIVNKDYLLESISLAGTSQEKIHNLIKAELDLISGDRGDAAAVLVHEWQNVSQESKNKLLTLRKEYEKIWIEVLKEAKAAGLIDINTDLTVFRNLLYGAIVWTSNWYNPRGRLNLETIADQILLMVIKSAPENCSP